MTSESRLTTQILRKAAVLHRWLGVALCLMLALWFATGSVLSFVPFPALGESQRLAGSEPLSLPKIAIAPNEALKAAGADEFRRLRLAEVNGEPRYLVTRIDSRIVPVSAVDGRLLPALNAAAARAVAEHFSGLRSTGVAGPLDYDQWTIHDKYPALRPYYRVSLQDDQDTNLYVSALTGQVAQRTQRHERAWNRVGAVIHWINVPALRANQPLWHRLMWSVALGGIALVVIGLFMGYARWWQHRRTRRAGLSPYRGALRWHHALGLFIGVIALSWVGSGWLSLDQGTWFPSDQPTREQLARYSGMSPRDLASTWPLALIRSLPQTREIEWRALAGRAVLVLHRETRLDDSLLVTDGSGQSSTRATLTLSLIRAAVENGWAPARALSATPIGADDAYQLRNYPWPASAVRVVLDDAAGTWVQVDAASGEILSVVNRRRRVYRWLVDGLHQLDFPWLRQFGPLWHVLLLTATGAGFVFSCIGVLLAWRRVRRKLFG